MICDILDRKMKEMREVRRREEIRDNQAEQEIIDRRFKTLVASLHQTMTALEYTKREAQFQLSGSILNDIENIFIFLQNAVRSGFAERDDVVKAETVLKTIQANVKKEWSKKYTDLTVATVSTLKVIAGIDSEKVLKCLEDISKGEVWSADIRNYTLMLSGLSEAKTLIDGLGLDQEIITFLQTMNSGKATLTDLSDKVFMWLRTESFDKRVRLSFINVAGRR